MEREYINVDEYLNNPKYETFEQQRKEFMEKVFIEWLSKECANTKSET